MTKYKLNGDIHDELLFLNGKILQHLCQTRANHITQPSLFL